MDAPSTASLRVKKITPRLIEIMNRMILGQPSKQIREEFGITAGRFSIIINSPLFRLALKKKLLKREEVIFDIQENILEGAKMGTRLYREILDPTNSHPTEIKLKAANAAAGLAVKMMNGSNGGNGVNGNGSEGEGKSYEERLREVTFKETVRTVIPALEDKSEQITDILAESYPEGEESLLSDADLLFGEIGEEDNFEPSKKIEDMIPKVEESVSKHDAD